MEFTYKSNRALNFNFLSLAHPIVSFFFVETISFMTTMATLSESRFLPRVKCCCYLSFFDILH